MSASVYTKRVKDFMTRDLVTLDAGDTIHEALELMSENRVSALPVVDSKNRCVGILSTADLVDLTRDAELDLKDADRMDASAKRHVAERLADRLGKEKVQSFMSESVVTVGLETLIGTAAREMLRNHIHHLPVVDQAGHLVGILSTMDLLAEFADAAP